MTITVKETGVAIDPFFPRLVPIGIQSHHSGFCSSLSGVSFVYFFLVSYQI